MPLLPINWFYRRLGKAYPVAFFGLQLSIGVFVTAGTLGLGSLYYEASVEQWLKLLAITEALTVVGLSFGFAKALPRLRPLKDWLAGDHSPSSAKAAWDAAVNLPVRVFKQDVALAVAMAGIPSVAIVMMELGLGLGELVPLLVVGVIAVIYAAVLQYFAIELGMRPVVDDIVATLPDDFHFEPVGLSVRAKLLTLLPLMSVFTGIVVAALSGGSNLGLSLLITLAVAFSLALELTLLLANSLSRPMNALRRGLHSIERGDYDVRIPVTTSDDLGELSDGFNRMAAGLAEREQLREAFGTYLDREVADYILSDAFDPAGAEVDVSILFCDVRDFTTFASEADASEVVAALNRLFEALVRIIDSHGGHVDKFLGDGMLAVFGTPEPFRDHADRAVAAARQIVAAVDAGEAGDLRVGVGVNSGRVVAGTIGGAGRLNFSVIGDAVNVAARVEAATRETGDSVLITRATREAMRASIPVASRGEVALKGKTEPIELFAVGAGRAVDRATAG